MTVPLAAIVTAAGEKLRSGVLIVAVDGAGGVDGGAGGVAGGVAPGGAPVFGGFGSEIGAAPPPPHAYRIVEAATRAVTWRHCPANLIA